GLRVAEPQGDGGVVAVRDRGGVGGGEGQPEQREGAAAAVQLLGEAGIGPAGVQQLGVHLGAGGLGAPPHRTVPGGGGDVVGERGHRGEADAEPADRGGAVPAALGRGAQGGHRLHALGGERGAGVGGGERVAVQPGQQPAGDAGAQRGVRGVLRQFDDGAVAVPAEGVVLFGVGVLPEPGGRRGPAVEYAPPQPGGAVRVGGSGVHGVSSRIGAALRYATEEGAPSRFSRRCARTPPARALAAHRTGARLRRGARSEAAAAGVRSGLPTSLPRAGPSPRSGAGKENGPGSGAGARRRGGALGGEREEAQPWAGGWGGPSEAWTRTKPWPSKEIWKASPLPRPISAPALAVRRTPVRSEVDQATTDWVSA